MGSSLFRNSLPALPPYPRSPSLCQDSQRSGDRNHQDTGHQLGRSHRRSLAFFFENDRDKFLILLSDGEDLEGEGLKRAKEAKDQGIRIYTIGIGSPEGARIPMDPLGQPARNFLKDPQGKTVISQMDQKCASKTFPTRPEVNTMQWVRQGKDWARSSSCFSPLGKEKTRATVDRVAD